MATGPRTERRWTLWDYKTGVPASAFAHHRRPRLFLTGGLFRGLYGTKDACRRAISGSRVLLPGVGRPPSPWWTDAGLDVVEVDVVFDANGRADSITYVNKITGPTPPTA